MSRKRKAPKRIFLSDTKYKSDTILKLMNSVMRDRKKTVAEKIVYDALDKLQTKLKEEPIKIFKQHLLYLKFDSLFHRATYQILAIFRDIP